MSVYYCGLSDSDSEAWWGGRMCSEWVDWCSTTRLQCSSESLSCWQPALCVRPPTLTLHWRRCVQNVCRHSRTRWKVFLDAIQQRSVNEFSLVVCSFTVVWTCDQHMHSVLLMQWLSAGWSLVEWNYGRGFTLHLLTPTSPGIFQHCLLGEGLMLVVSSYELVLSHHIIFFSAGWSRSCTRRVGVAQLLVCTVPVASVVVRTQDLQSTGRVFHSRPPHCRVATLDKSFTRAQRLSSYDHMAL